MNFVRFPNMVSGSSWLAFAILWSVTQMNHVNRARVVICWQLPTHVCQSFTRQIWVHQHEKVGEKVGENRAMFYLSPTVCQRVCRLFLCRSHTPTWVYNTSLPTFVCCVKAALAGAAFVSCAKAPPAKRSEEGHGDQNGVHPEPAR